MTESTNAKDLMLKNMRLDLMIKYIFFKNHYKYKTTTNFFKNLYLEHIQAFNGFYEKEPLKNSKDDFLNAAHETFKSLTENGFIAETGAIPVGSNGELINGAHRIAAAAALNLQVPIERVPSKTDYDYAFFKERGLDGYIADIAALEFVKLNPNAYIVNLHSVNSMKHDSDVEAILNKYGSIYYKKEIDVNFNGYVNLKKLSYGFDFWDGEKSWIGSYENDFQGAKTHAQESMGDNPLRAFVFVCDSLEKAVKAKEEIRDIYKINTFSVHINDSREEAIALAQIYFNDNSIDALNKTPYNLNLDNFNKKIDTFKTWIQDQGIDIENVCACGSTPMELFDLRKSNDFDFLHSSENAFKEKHEFISSHEEELKFYPKHKNEIIHNPQNHFYYRGVKFISIETLIQMKEKRGEVPKDLNDVEMLRALQKNLKVKRRLRKVIYIKLIRLKEIFMLFLRHPFFIFSKKKRRKISILIKQLYKD